MPRGRKKGGMPVIERKRTSKTFSPEVATRIPPSGETGLETLLRANTGVFRPMNKENGTLDVKIFRRGLNVQVR
jgi:hypothetical protein